MDLIVTEAGVGVWRHEGPNGGDMEVLEGYILILKTKDARLRGWRDDLAVKSPCCSSGGPEFGFYTYLGRLTTAWTPAPGDHCTLLATCAFS